MNISLGGGRKPFLNEVNHILAIAFSLELRVFGVIPLVKRPSWSNSQLFPDFVNYYSYEEN